MPSLLTYMLRQDSFCRLLNAEWSIQVIGALAVCKEEVSCKLAFKPGRQSLPREFVKNHSLAQKNSETLQLSEKVCRNSTLLLAPSAGKISNHGLFIGYNEVLVRIDSCSQTLKLSQISLWRHFIFTLDNLYGKGVYFAAQAGYSARSQFSPPGPTGLRHMYLARVLVGEYTVGKPDILEPPPKHPADLTDTYDSVVDQIPNPEIFVVFQDPQCYPEYLITFQWRPSVIESLLRLLPCTVQKKTIFFFWTHCLGIIFQFRFSR